MTTDPTPAVPMGAESLASTSGTAAPLSVRVRYFAAAGEAAGTDAETIPVPADLTVGGLRAHLGDRHGAELTRILGISALLIDGRNDLPEDAVVAQVLGADATVDVLPPFAGG